MTDFTGFAEYASDIREFKNELAAFRREVPDAIDRGMGTTARAVAQTARELAPRSEDHDAEDGERLADSIEVVHVGLMQWRVVVRAEHGPHVEYGTTAHRIEPRDADALHFEIDGREVFAAYVEHPGTFSQPFLRPAFNRHKDELESNVMDELEQVAARVFS